MLITSVQRAVARSDPDGLDVRWDISGPAIVDHVFVDLLEDGEPGWDIGFDPDGRAVRGVRVKPVKEGVFTLYVEAGDSRGKCNSATAATKVTVVK